MRYVIVITLLVTLVSPLSAVIDFFSPRALALGMGGLSFSYDFTALYGNPALLSNFQFSVTGLTYQNRYSDLLKMEEHLDGLLQSWRQKGSGLPLGSEGQEHLNALSESGSGLYGFDAKIPGFLIKNFGVGVARTESAFMAPVLVDGSIIAADRGEPLFHAVALKYTQYSLAYAMPVSQNVFFGLGAHFMTGKIGVNDYSINDSFFEIGLDTHDYVNRAVDSCQEKFTKIVCHIGLIWKVAQTFDVSLTVENIGDPSLLEDEDKGINIELKHRYRASFSFRPVLDWGFYVDADINKTPIYPGFEQKRQPVSLGIEKGFFQNSAFLRAGFNTDISRKYILGKNSYMTLSFGVGIRVNAFLVDAGLILNGNGTVNGLAIAGYYVVN